MSTDKTAQLLSGMARAIDETLQEAHGRKLGFFLAVFDFNAPGETNYISNACRDDIIKAMRETADRFEKGETMPPTIGTA